MTSSHTRILVIEDDASIVLLITRMLTRLGYEAAGIAATGAEALRQAVESRPDLALVDIKLEGELDGIAVAAHLRAYLSLPVIYLTAYADEETLRRAKETEPDGYLVKPFQEINLQAAIEMALHRHKMQQALRDSEERFRTVANFTYDWEYWVGANGRHIYVSPSCERISGYTAAEFMQDPNLLQAIIHPNDQTLMRQHQNDQFNSSDTASLDFRIITRGGEERWLNHVCTPVYGDDGRWLGRRASNRDITERKHAEQLLAQRAVQLAIINDIGRQITTTLKLDSVLEQAAQLVQARFNYHHVALFLIEGDALKLKAVAGAYAADFPPGHPQQLDQGLYGWVATHGQKIIANDVHAEPRYISPTAGYAITQAELALPIKIGRDTVGVLDIQSRHLNAFSANDVLALETLTDQIAVAIVNSRLYETAQQELAERERVERSLQDNLQRTEIAYEQATIYAQELAGEIVERKRVEKALREAHDELEFRVLERTMDLSKANEDLQAEIQMRERVEAKLVYDAMHDGLTALSNRTCFIDRVRQSIRQAKENEKHLFAVLFLDLDRFKVVNDSLGHLVGDELLVAVAARLLMCVDDSAIVARLGGDEFAILLDPIKSVDEAVRAAEQIQQEMALPLAVHDETVFTTVSIGITLSTTGYEQPEECLRDADTAMYQAKANGRARYEIFSPNMHADAFSLWQLDADLRRAVERREFEIHYQPIVSLANGRINGAEALLRWQHPERGLLDPAEFMPLAEETGLIVPIGEWTVHQACHQVKAWHQQGYSFLEVAVNISARQFQHQNIPRLIESALQKTNLPIEALVIEITESVATKSVDTGLASLYELSAMGIKISIDDFGIGSALDCLKRFPLHYLKIDQSFIRDIMNDPANAAITRAIIDMAHSLNLTVIAEGVETEEQLAFLRSHQCDFVQGYLLSHPLTVEAFTQLLQHDSNSV